MFDRQHGFGLLIAGKRIGHTDGAAMALCHIVIDLTALDRQL